MKTSIDMTPSVQIGRLVTICVVAVLTLVGCVDAPKKKTEEVSATLFYPPLPNAPRIQYLTSFSSSKDLVAPVGSFGEFILGDETEDPNGVKKPYGVAMYGHKIFVADTRGNGYAVFDLDKKRYDFVHGSGGGAMLKPINITIDKDGTKYITDTNKDQILVFDARDNFVRAYGVEGQFKPGDTAIVGNKLYVTDLKHHNIQVLDKATGKVLNTIGKVGSKEGDMYFPTNLAVGPNGHLYVSDTGNFRVQEFTQSGKVVRSFGSVGTGLGHFARPKGVALDRKGRVYVVDAAFENVQMLDPDGRLLLFFGEPGANHPAGLDLPTDITLDYASAAYFQRYAEPNFKLEYVILIANQFGRTKVNVFGFGQMAGMDYSDSL